MAVASSAAQSWSGSTVTPGVVSDKVLSAIRQLEASDFTIKNSFSKKQEDQTYFSVDFFAWFSLKKLVL